MFGEDWPFFIRGKESLSILFLTSHQNGNTLPRHGDLFVEYLNPLLDLSVILPQLINILDHIIEQMRTIFGSFKAVELIEKLHET